MKMPMLPKKLKYWAIPVILVVAIALASSTGVFSAGKNAKQVVANTATSVATAPVASVNKKPTITLNGSIEGQTSATVSAKISGRIQEVLVQDGQAVKAGEPLVIMESTELANSTRMSRDSVIKAQATYDNSLADYNRYLTLFQQNAVSRQQLDSAETRLKIAQADLSSANASLSNSQQQYEYATITAPVDGVVANKTATIGQVVSPGVQLLSVEHISEVYAVVNVEQKDMGVIQPGMAADITVDAFPGQVFAGVVEIINPAAGTGNRMFKAKVKLDNAANNLKPGMFVKVQLITGQEAAVLAIPQSAILQKQGLYYVYTIEGDKVARRQIEIGQAMGDLMEVKSGLNANQILAISNVNNLKDGDPVQVAK